jgi:hypothetical protein
MNEGPEEARRLAALGYAARGATMSACEAKLTDYPSLDRRLCAARDGCCGRETWRTGIPLGPGA